MDLVTSQLPSSVQVLTRDQVSRTYVQHFWASAFWQTTGYKSWRKEQDAFMKKLNKKNKKQGGNIRGSRLVLRPPAASSRDDAGL